MAVEARLQIGSILDGTLVEGVGEPLALPSKLQKLATQKLATARRREAHLQGSGRYRGYKDRPFTEFRRDYIFEELVEKVIQDLPQLPDTASEETFRRSLRGKVFEELAYRVLADDTGSDSIVISPDDTFEFFRALHPRNMVVTDHFQKSIMGVYVPDGLMIDARNGGVSHILEYTTSLDSKAGGEQLNGARNVVFSRRSLGNAQFTLVYPAQDVSVSTAVRLNGVAKKELPFSLTNFRQLEDEMYTQALYKLGWIARPEDVEARRKYEKGVYLLNAKAEGNPIYEMPEAWQIYGWEHGLRTLPDEPVVFWPQD